MRGQRPADGNQPGAGHPAGAGKQAGTNGRLTILDDDWVVGRDATRTRGLNAEREIGSPHSHVVPDSLLVPKGGFVIDVDDETGVDLPTDIDLKSSGQTMGRDPHVTRALAIFDWCEAILPKRVASEEIGDALEKIHEWLGDPTCTHRRAKITVKVVSTIVVLLLNSVRLVVSSALGKKAE